MYAVNGGKFNTMSLIKPDKIREGPNMMADFIDC